jgi:UDP-GlcNAc:undecaprenyl-phosphate GlcNAc-1-phosphate transferase
MLKNIDYVAALVISFFLCAILVPLIIWLAKKWKILDYPIGEKKIHKKPIPLLGGVAIFCAFSIVVGIYYFFSTNLHGNLLPKHLIGVFVGGLILVIGGILDDKFTLKPKYNIIFPVLAIICVIASGIGIDWLTNPITGGVWYLDELSFKLFSYHGLPYRVAIVADIFTFVWLLGMIYTTKILDGLDGLVSGIAVIGGLFIFLTSINKEFVQPDIALLAMIFVGCYLAFLLFNFNPAKVFLGESGSTFAGFILGVLSIISGSKVSITLILMGIPALDVLWTIIRRLMEKKNPFGTSDQKHLHHRLLAAGFSVKRATIFLYSISLIFGSAAILLQQRNFGILILGLAVLTSFILITAYLYKITKENQKKTT